VHDAAAAVVLGPTAAVLFVLSGTRAWLAITGRTAGRRLRTIIGLESQDYKTSRGGLVFDVAFALLGEVLILALLVDNLNRPDGKFAAGLAALEIAFVGLWIGGLFRVTAGRAGN
jgi:hypothetical protein